jgi:hypothetical protein
MRYIYLNEEVRFVFKLVHNLIIQGKQVYLILFRKIYRIYRKVLHIIKAT